MASSNVVILLVGLHGAGKSTFTRAATGRHDINLGRGVGPLTLDRDRSPKGFKFTIIDTPGLADKNTTEQNLEVLQDIADQLRQMGKERVNGVIYFHSIEGGRLHGVDMVNIRLLKAICGEPFFPRVAFVTTRWDRMRDSDYKMLMKRNTELEGARKELLPHGPEIFRFLNDGKSHQPVLEYFARQSSEDAQPLLLFAQELERYRQRRLRSAVRKTTAGKQVATKGKVRKAGICSFL
ncbi:P-loop containing nucleoside triphosphate hydrolase protein [Madurella fahalii]|uniref:P-loop containing nucleoside triphosphate hydrolase protein n=1 Tax=Madurella fahalii TaxID=1157608 RepID=A0ABQ0GGZ2_9PEZI